MARILRAGSRLLGGGVRALAVPVPVLGAERVTNSEFTPVSLSPWGAGPGGGTTAIARYDCAISPNIAPTGGIDNYAIGVKIGSNPANGFAYCYPIPTFVLNEWYIASGNVYIPSTNTTKSGRIRFNTASRGVTLSNQWNNVVIAFYSTNAGLPIYLDNLSTTTDDIVYFDAISIKAITLASMFSTRAYTTHATTKAKATVIAGTRAGVVANLDSATSPANFVIASHDSTTARLTKCAGGTYTELISTAVAYSAGAFVEIRRLASTNTFQLWYNGSQVGTNQTISDAGIVSNTLHGLFNTYASNALSDFSCVASA